MRTSSAENRATLKNVRLSMVKPWFRRNMCVRSLAPALAAIHRCSSPADVRKRVGGEWSPLVNLQFAFLNLQSAPLIRLSPR